MALIFWSKLGSAGEIITPETGPIGTINGSPTYSAAKFGNGIDGCSSTNNAKFSGVMTAAQFNGTNTFEFWVKSHYSSTDVSAPSKNNQFLDSTESGGSYGWFGIEYNNVNYLGYLLVTCYNYAASGSQYKFAIAFAAEQLFHLAVIVDQSAANKIRVFFNGSEVAVTTKIYNNVWNFSINPIFTMYDAPDGAAFYSKSVIDNLKIYNSAKTSYTDRLWEDGAGIPIGVSATQETYIDKVTVSWSAVIGDLSGYRVYRSASSGGSYVDISGLLSSATLTYDDTSMVAGTHYFYKVRSETTLANSDLSSASEGWALLMSTSCAIPEETLPVYGSKIIVGGLDLWQKNYVSTFPIIEYFKSFDRDRLFLNELNIQVINYDGLFSPDSTRSIYSGIDWKGTSVKVYDPDSTLIWDGELNNIIRNHKNLSAALVSNNSLYSERYSKAVYTSADWETGSDAVKNILDALSIANYNQNSINQSDAILTAAGVYLKVTVTADDNKNLVSILEEIAQYSNADIFDYNGDIYFQCWRPSASLLPSLTITDTDLIDPPMVEMMDKLINNDYKIAYNGDGGTPATDTDNNNLGSVSRAQNGVYAFNLSGSGGKTELKDLTSAVWVGEQAMKRTHRNFASNPRGLVRIMFSVPMDFGAWFDLYTVFKFTYSLEGWVEKLFEIYKLKLNYNTRVIEIEAFELGS